MENISKICPFKVEPCWVYVCRKPKGLDCLGLARILSVAKQAVEGDQILEEAVSSFIEEFASYYGVDCHEYREYINNLPTEED